MIVIKKFSTLVELMILVPLFTFSIYVAIFFGEVTLSKINGVVSSRYIAETTEVVDDDAIRNLFTTERGKAADQSQHFWAGNQSIKITKQDKAQGQWPISETGKPGNVIHEYLIEYGFDVNVSYELVGNNLVARVNFTHPPGGLDLMRYFLYSEADDVIQKVLQERITYSNSSLEFDYENDSVIPSNFNDMKNNNGNKTNKIPTKSESRNMILLENTLSRNFYKEMTSVNRLTSPSYDSSSGNGQRLSDGRMSSGSAITNDAGTNQLPNSGSQDLYWTANSKYETVRGTYPILGDLVNKLTIDPIDEQSIKIEEMEDSFNNMTPNWGTLPVDKTFYSAMGL